MKVKMTFLGADVISIYRNATHLSSLITLTYMYVNRFHNF